jgi:TPP-dependent trihydroxycyclohexane-1,2-dione (THcHDO) dehydratase
VTWLRLTQDDKSSLPPDHRYNFGRIGVTGTAATNALATEANLTIADGRRLQDFTTGSLDTRPVYARRLVSYEASERHHEGNERPRNIALAPL